MASHRILLIDDDAAVRRTVTRVLEIAGYEVVSAEDGESGLSAFAQGGFALVITDVRMPGISGLVVVERVRDIDPEVPIVVVTGYGSVEMAVEAMKAGAADFIGKPVIRDHLLLAVARAIERGGLRRELRALRIRAAGVERPMVAESVAMKEIVALVDRAARSRAPVFIGGEMGTGRESLARRLHVGSERAEGPFVCVDCEALPADRVEHELFGRTEDEGRSASEEVGGRIAQAQGGTLFLDDASELPLAVQGRFLRILEQGGRVVSPNGERRPLEIRVVASASRPLAALIEEGKLRRDLALRLGVVEISVPPLRDRPEDVPALARHFVARHGEGRRLDFPEALGAELRRRPWPGNVRELENACQRLVVLADGERLDLSALDGPGASVPSGVDDFAAWLTEGDFLERCPPLPPEGFSLVDLERRVVERVLDKVKGNVSAAARYLRVPRHILTYRMEKYGIER